LLDLSVVQGSTGLGVQTTPGEDLDGRLSAWLFLHGYNTSPLRAGENFELLLETIINLGLRRPVKADRSWLVAWHGYQRRMAGWQESWTSGFTYPWQVPYAVEVGKALAEYISGLSGPGDSRIEITFVAHSLGCRVVLEVLNRLASMSHDRVSIKAAFLMAAAVPCGFVRAAGHLNSGTKVPQKTYVVFSSRDQVLRRKFPLGQFVAERKTRGVRTAAVGLYGQPVGTWSSRFETDTDHSGYFGDSITSMALARVLGVAVPRPLVSRSLRSRGVFPRHCIESMTLSSRVLVSRAFR